jgi:hypothetical protein
MQFSLDLEVQVLQVLRVLQVFLQERLLGRIL